MSDHNSRPVVGWVGGEGWAYLSFPGADEEFEQTGGWAMDRPTTEQLIKDLQEAVDHMPEEGGTRE